MNTIQYPLNLPLTPSAYTLEMISMSNIQSSPYNMRQTISLAPAAQMWGLYLTFSPIVNPVLAGSVSAFLSGLRGRLGSFKFYLSNRDLSYTGSSTLLYKAVLNDTRNLIEISNASSLNPGTYITIGTQLLKVLSISGDEVNIFPSLRKDINVDTEVNYTNNTVFGLFRQKNHSGNHTFNNNHVYTFSIDAVEATNVPFVPSPPTTTTTPEPTTTTTPEPTILNVEYLVIAGGGGGGSAFGGGGGGAGGYRTAADFAVAIGELITVTVGGGGAENTNGSNSVFSAITSNGGGAGSGHISSAGDGGSGGGGRGPSGANPRPAGSGNTPSTSPSQGNNGGTGHDEVSAGAGGGGGGAGAVGEAASSSSGANGGSGAASSITGSSITRAGGGGGGSEGGSVGSGGSGGGGGGSSSAGGSSGSTNTGGGGGGGQFGGGTGGSGVVILRYPEAYTLSIGAGLTSSTTTVGNDKVTTFTAGADDIEFNL